MGYSDAIRAIHPIGAQYTYWDYQAGAWQRDNGIRIDHLMLSPEAADKLINAGVAIKARASENAHLTIPCLDRACGIIARRLCHLVINTLGWLFLFPKRRIITPVVIIFSNGAYISIVGNTSVKKYGTAKMNIIR